VDLQNLKWKKEQSDPFNGADNDFVDTSEWETKLNRIYRYTYMYVYENMYKYVFIYIYVYMYV
jgi:hypothetical protein